MSNNIKAYEGMGSILARLPFNTSLKSSYSSKITEEEQGDLHHALQASVSALIRARQYCELEDDALEACADGFALALTRIFVGARLKHRRPVQTMQVDGQTWELVFDPGPKTEHLRTDEKGRVWRKAEGPFSDLSDSIPF
jgi:poly(A) polymerase Pap1